MTATLAAFTVAAFLEFTNRWYAAGIAMLLGVLTMLVQWLCTDPPHVSGKRGLPRR